MSKEWPKELAQMQAIAGACLTKMMVGEENWPTCRLTPAQAQPGKAETGIACHFVPSPEFLELGSLQLYLSVSPAPFVPVDSSVPRGLSSLVTLISAPEASGFRAFFISFYSYDHALTTREAGPPCFDHGSVDDTDLFLPDPDNVCSVPISRTLPSDDPLYSGFAEGTGAHLSQQQFSFYPGAGSLLVGQDGTLPFCGTCGSVDVHFQSNNGQLQFEDHSLIINTALGTNFGNNDSILHMLPDHRDGQPAQVLDFLFLGDATNRLDAPFPSHDHQTMATSPVKVRDFDAERVVTQSLPISFPFSHHDSPSASNSVLSPDYTSHSESTDTPSLVVTSTTTDDELGIFGPTHDSEMYNDDPPTRRQQIPRQQRFPCPVCKRRFATITGLQYEGSDVVLIFYLFLLLTFVSPSVFSLHQNAASHHHLAKSALHCNIPECKEQTRNFKSRRELNRHHQSEHTAPVKLPCTEVMKRRQDKVLKHARGCSKCGPQMDFIKKQLGIPEGVKRAAMIPWRIGITRRGIASLDPTDAPSPASPSWV
ncbi:hypothetical protein V8F06_014165 [Rhypophila decipiens]